MKRRSTEPDFSLPSKRTSAARPSVRSPSPQIKAFAKKWIDPRAEPTPAENQDDSDSGDEDEWGRRHSTEEPVKPTKHMFTAHDDHYHPPEPPKSFSLDALIDSIPLVDRAPVGRRRLVRKKDLDDEDEDEETDEEPSGLTREEQIESDRAMITEAAGRLLCKRTWVTITRKEEIVAAGDRGEAAVAARFAENAKDDDELEDVDRKGKGKAKPPVSSDDEDDEDMVLRRPGESAPKHKAPPNPNQPKAPEPNINDDMEWIQGGDLGQRDASKQFKDITEKKLMWRVPGMRTPLLEHQVLGVDWMVKHEMSDARPRGGLVADVMGLGKVYPTTSHSQDMLTPPTRQSSLSQLWSLTLLHPPQKKLIRPSHSSSLLSRCCNNGPTKFANTPKPATSTYTSITEQPKYIHSRRCATPMSSSPPTPRSCIRIRRQRNLPAALA